MRPLVVMTVLLGGPLIAAPVPKAIKVKTDDEAIVGVWKVVAVEGLDRRLLSTDEIAQTRFYFFEDGLFVFNTPTSWSHGGKFKLDPKARVKGFTLTRGDVTFGGLYKLDGDSLTLCWNLKTLQTPSELKADGEGVVVWTLKRETDEKNGTREDK